MNYNQRAKNVSLGLMGNGKVPIAFDAGLVAGSHSLSQWMASEFNHNFDEYDSAIDAVYNSSYIGGSSYHHLLDGQHTILGAFQAAQDVKADDTFATEFLQAGEHLLRDTASVSGVNPFFSLTQNQFEKLASVTESIGISKTFLADILTINGPELLGGLVTITSSIIIGKKNDPTLLSKLSGSYLISSIGSANPLTFPIAAEGLVYSIKKAGNKKEAIIKAAKGSIVSGGTLMASSLVGGPFWVSCILAVTAALAIDYAIEKPEKTVKMMKQLINPSSSILRKASLSI
ncbi:hypothetical protein [Virgibacillus halodenitrificans]|uniref:hypothetical protein n=1 Tax=Virgibacillus halodenitrificans TaxID=1482 RepID=UPI001F3DB47A|nr:hypothetical protein [Virgibacillus halodenitrificans]